MVFKKPQLLALVSFLAIPALLMAGGALLSFIDPEKLARLGGAASYSSDFRTYQHLRVGLLVATIALCVVAWFVSCSFVLKSKGRSYRWLPFALFGPFGLVVLVSLRDLGIEPGAAPRQETGWRRILLRIFLEAGIFVVFSCAAFTMMETERDISIATQAVRTGMTREQVLERRAQEGGMWAFREGVEVLFFLGLLYLLRPIAGGAVRHLLKRREPPEGA